MIARFELPLETEIAPLLEDIAQRYGTIVKTLDDEKNKMIKPQSKLRILQRMDENHITIKVRGASNEDIDFLKGVLGNPKMIAEENRSALELANEVIKIPEVRSKSNEEIMEHLDIEEDEFNLFMKQMERGASRGRGPEAIQKAYEILTKNN